MWYAVSARVAHLIFDRVFLYSFALKGQGSLKGVVCVLAFKQQLGAGHIGFQAVSGVLKIGAHAQVFAGFGLRQPVLSLQVVGFLLFCVKGRPYERERCVFRKMACDVYRAKEGAKHIFLLAIKVNFKRFYVLHCSEAGFAVRGHKGVVVIRYVAHEGKAPALVGFIGKVGLIIDKARAILACGL